MNRIVRLCRRKRGVLRETTRTLSIQPAALSAVTSAIVLRVCSKAATPLRLDNNKLTWLITYAYILYFGVNLETRGSNPHSLGPKTNALPIKLVSKSDRRV